jgi:hypothetical protein
MTPRRLNTLLTKPKSYVTSKEVSVAKPLGGFPWGPVKKAHLGEDFYDPVKVSEFQESMLKTRVFLIERCVECARVVDELHVMMKKKYPRPGRETDND